MNQIYQSSIWGHIFEISVQRGVLSGLIHKNILQSNHPVFEQWSRYKIFDINSQLITKLNITDENAKEWANSMLRHLLIFGYGLGWTVIRQYIKKKLSNVKIQAIWCPLTMLDNARDHNSQEIADKFLESFQLPVMSKRQLLNKGEPANADFLLWLSNNKNENFILTLEFSHNAPVKLLNFNAEEAHREEISSYARYLESRGVFSRVCAEVDSDESFSLNSNLYNHLCAFSSSDKPLFKLTQASSYTEKLIHLLQTHKKIEGPFNARAIAVTSNGFESLAARFINQNPEPDPRVSLMKSLGKAYREARKIDDDSPDELNIETKLVLNKIIRSLPEDFKEQITQQKMLDVPNLGGYIRYEFIEKIKDFYNSMHKISRNDAIAAIEENSNLDKFFGTSPQAKFAEELGENEEITLRDAHSAAVVAGLKAVKNGKLNLIALEGNPGIGKTTSVIKFLKQEQEGFLFLYVSPRVVINRDVIVQLARKNDQPSGILTMTTNSDLIVNGPEWGKKHAGKNDSNYDSAVIVDGVDNLVHPLCNTLFLTPEQEHEIDSNFIGSKRFKTTLNRREDIVRRPNRPGVLKTLGTSARKLLEKNPSVNHIVLTAAIQGYRNLDNKTTIDGLSQLFKKESLSTHGKNERNDFAKRIPNIVVMIDELTGDSAGALFVHAIAEWLNQQFINIFDGNSSPYKVTLIVSDASLSNEIVFNSYLKSGVNAPSKVLISPSRGQAPFRVTGTETKVGPKKYPALHIMTNSFPASQLTINYVIRLSPVTPGLNSSGAQQTIRQAIREQLEDELLKNAKQEIQKGLNNNAQQIIFFAQDKAFLRQLKENLTQGAEAILDITEVEVLDQSVPPPKRIELLQESKRDEIRVFLMTSSGARGVSFPKTNYIIASIPRFNIESSLMEVAQLIYRGRGNFTSKQPSLDDKSKNLVMLIDDFTIDNNDSDQTRSWLRKISDLLTLLMMLRATIHTRIKGDAGLKRQRIAFVPVGLISDEELVDLISGEVIDFLKEANVFVRDKNSDTDKGIVNKAAQLTEELFTNFNLEGNNLTENVKSYTDYQSLENFTKAVSCSTSSLIPSLENKDFIIPDNITCVGPYWVETWKEKNIDERFNFESWQKDFPKKSGDILGLLKQIYENNNFPPKLKRPAKELHQLLIRKKEEYDREYSTSHAINTENIAIGLPLDYPHFLNQQSKDNLNEQVLEDPQVWKNALGFSLTPQGTVLPAIAKYKKFPWAAVFGKQITAQLEVVFDDRFFMASSELNLLNTILFEDVKDGDQI